MIIDSHCHIDFTEFDCDRENVLAQANNLGITKIIVPGVMQQTWQRITDYCKQYPQLYPCYGLHPYFINKHSEEDITKLKKIIKKTQWKKLKKLSKEKTENPLNSPLILITSVNNFKMPTLVNP